MEPEDSDTDGGTRISQATDVITNRFAGRIIYYTVKYSAVAVLFLSLVGVLAPGSVVGDVISDPSIISSDSESESSSISEDASPSGSDSSSDSSTSSGGGSTTSSNPDLTPEFQLNIVDRRPCDENERLCREVDIKLDNSGSDATNVDISVDIVTEGVFSEATIYETSESVDKINSGGSIKRTERIAISPSDVPSIRANGCSIAAKVHIESDDYSDTYWTEPEKVGC